MRGVNCVLALMLLTGCATVKVLPEGAGTKTAHGKTVVETIAVDNTDWRLLCVLPIASGDVASPNTVSCRWFRDTVTLQNQMDMIAAEAARCGATQAVDVRTYENEEDFFLLAFLRRKMHTSAVLVK